MTSSSHSMFRILTGWCCLMSSALLIMTPETSMTVNEEPNSTEINGKNDRLIDFQRGPPFNNYIRLIRDRDEIWICDPCKSSSLSLKNSTVEITVSGLYYVHAQVTFPRTDKMPDSATVTLRKNKGPGTQERNLSKVKHYGAGSATMIRLVELSEGDSISLEIHPINSISGQDYDTYWEMIFF